MYSVTVTTSTPGSANYCVELPTPSNYAEAMFYQSVADSSPFLFVEGTTFSKLRMTLETAAFV